MKRIRICFFVVVIFCLLIGCESIQQRDRNQKLVWCVAGVWDCQTQEDVASEQEALNQALKESGFTCQVEIKVIPPTHNGFTEEQQEQIEQSDIITMMSQFMYDEESERLGAFLPTIGTAIEDQVFEPLDAWMETESGKELQKLQIFNLIRQSGTVEGVQWLLPTNVRGPRGASLMIQKSLWLKAGFTEDDMVPDFAECDEIFEKLYQANDGQPILHFSAEESTTMINDNDVLVPQFLSDIQEKMEIGEYIAGIGTVIEGDKLYAGNLMETEKVKEIMDAWQRYWEKGYVSLETTRQQALVTMYRTFETEMQEETVDETTYVIPKAKSYIQIMRTVEGDMTRSFVGISAQSDRKELAFDVLACAIQNSIGNVEGKERGKITSLAYSAVFEEDQTWVEHVLNTPMYTEEAHLPVLDVKKVQKLNQVFKKYCTTNQEKTEKLYFSGDTQWLETLNRELKEAGIDQIVKELNK